MQGLSLPLFWAVDLMPLDGRVTGSLTRRVGRFVSKENGPMLLGPFETLLKSGRPQAQLGRWI